MYEDKSSEEEESKMCIGDFFPEDRHNDKLDLFAHVICCISFPQVFCLTDIIQMRFMIHNYELFSDDKKGESKLFQSVNMLTEEDLMKGGVTKDCREYTNLEKQY
jgi:hypothetical protein